jgi:GH25 family lysozyme M1 (1,4-beta-N-acetylmuramidase)
MIGYGVDVSHHQDPEAVPWQRLQGKVDFVIVRAAYGNKLDQHAKEHVRRARDIGAKVGLYLFFRPGQRWEDEARALESVSDSCIIENGDIIPSLDIEDDPFSIPKEVSKVWEDGCRRIIERWSDIYGDAMVYITDRCWKLLGQPEWVLHRPLWIPNYGVVKPRTPAGMPATIWQHRISTFDPFGPSEQPDPAPPGTIDQNRLLLPLPLVGYRPSSDDQERVKALVAENLRRAVQEPELEEELAPDTPRLT